MKSLCTALVIGLLPAMAMAQTAPPTSTDTPAPKAPPIEPVLEQQHQGAGRIGVRLDFDKTTGIPTIVALIRSGPAEDFGFQVGDKIIKIDRNFTTTLTKDQVSIALHGQPGSPVELTIQRNDDPHLIIRSLSRAVLSAHADEMVNPPMLEVIKPPADYPWM